MTIDALLGKGSYFTAIDGVASFPDAMASIRTAVRDRAATPPSVARAVERDVAFASRLLRIVNAPAVGLIRPCASVAHAVSLIGMSRIGMLAEATASQAAIERCASVAPELAARAAMRAAIARAIASAVDAPAEQAFTSALLADVGMVAMLATQPECQTIWSSSGTGAESLAAERTAMGFDHPELGGDILRRWNMPTPIPDVVAFHHDLDAAREHGREIERLVALVQVANALVPTVLKHVAAEAEELAALATAPAFATLGLDAAKLTALWPLLKDSLRTGDAITNDGVVTARRPRFEPPAPAAKKKQHAVWVVAAVVPVVVAAFALLR